MKELFWCFLIYSFLGFLLEIAFARLIHSPKPDRKCHLSLPVCPGYGLGALGILLLPSWIKAAPPLLYLGGALMATLAEWSLAVFYEKALGVHFWNYCALPLNFQGRVCLWFSLFWGFLALPLCYLVQPVLVGLIAAIPTGLTVLAALFYLWDTVISFLALRLRGTEGLRWYRSLKPFEVH